MATSSEPARSLVELEARHGFFVGIDSDGCAFDTMEVKHKECFIPNTIKHWGLQPVSRYAREAAEFINLYSRWRGINRWPALAMTFDLLRDRPEVLARRVEVTEAAMVRRFIASGLPLSNEGCKAFKQEYPSLELETAWAWTTGVNSSVADLVHGVPPFPCVRESLQFLAGRADMIVVSATPGEALAREWAEHDLARYVRTIAGQELGSKKQQVELAAKGKYASNHILIVGDAPGDQEAARANGALFYPINPGHEDESWQRFLAEAVHKFLAGEYAGDYEEQLAAQFEKLLPETPPWKR